MNGQAAIAVHKYRFTGRNKKTFSRTSLKYRQRCELSFNHYMDLNKYITNLSGRTLTGTQKCVLSLGLKFIPSSKGEQNATMEAFSKFQRSIRLKHYFKDSAPKEPHPFRGKSDWDPPRASREVEEYLHRVKEGLNNPNTIPIRHNLGITEIKALRELSRDPTLVIKSADKGSGIVVEDRETYIRDGLVHLTDTNLYKKVDSDPTTMLGEALNIFTDNLYKKGVIDTITREYLLFKSDNMPRTQQMYFLKKIHKSQTAVRPICSGCGGPTEKLSRLIDHYIKPFVPHIKSYIRDSGHLIETLEQTQLPSTCTIGSIDIKAMYNHIPHDEGIKAIMNRLYTKNPNADLLHIPPGSI